MHPLTTADRDGHRPAMSFCATSNKRIMFFMEDYNSKEDRILRGGGMLPSELLRKRDPRSGMSLIKSSG